MNRLAVGSVWQSGYLLGLNVSNMTGFMGIGSVDAEFYSGQDRQTDRQTDSHGWES